GLHPQSDVILPVETVPILFDKGDELLVFESVRRQFRSRFEILRDLIDFGRLGQLRRRDEAETADKRKRKLLLRVSGETRKQGTVGESRYSYFDSTQIVEDPRHFVDLQVANRGLEILR